MSASAPLPELYVFVSAKPRVQTLLDGNLLPRGADPSIDEIVAATASATPAWSWTLAGGEPTTRSDLPELISELSRAGAPRLGLRTDGLALTKVASIEALKGAGLKRVVIPFHSGRSDAHDWLVQTPGAARRTRKAIQIISSRGIAVEAEVVLTRPTSPYLDETVQLLARLGVRAIHFRRPVLTHLGAMAIGVSPRLGLLQPYLTEAVRRARSLGLVVQLHDLPQCASPDGFNVAGPTRSITWSVPPSIDWHPPTRLESRIQCGDCPAICSGAPQDYTHLFGFTEFASEATADEPQDTEDGSAAVPAPAPRHGWQPATRVSAATERARFGPPHRTPLPADHHQILTLNLASGAPSRTARSALVRAAQDRPAILHLTGHWLTHPQGLKLLAETRFFLGDVHLTGLIHPLAKLNDRALGRLERLRKVSGILLSSTAETHDRLADSEGAYAHTVALFGRLSTLGIETELVVEATDRNTIESYTTAVQQGQLPALPRFTEAS